MCGEIIVHFEGTMVLSRAFFVVIPLLIFEGIGTAANRAAWCQEQTTFDCARGAVSVGHRAPFADVFFPEDI